MPKKRNLSEVSPGAEESPQPQKMQGIESPLHKAIREFVETLQTVSQSCDGWGGKGVTGRWMEKNAETGHRADVNAFGAKHGCHTCKSFVLTDPNQPWIGDHQPPTGLTLKSRLKLGLPEVAVYDGSVRLRPQCDSCSRKQATAIKRINARAEAGTLKMTDLTEEERHLVGLAPPFSHGFGLYRDVMATNATVNATQGRAIQDLGVLNGCHSCPSWFPADAYHADHCPPFCCTKSWVCSIIEYANQHALSDMKIPTEFELRPQCPRCSHEQGGKMKNLDQRARAIAQKLDITVYGP
ncbi:MAG: hypothetical protein NTY19_29955 [Planctomycetota bacterium]|nr:hypothetical protein [Planctomycetota bacterium]